VPPVTFLSTSKCIPTPTLEWTFTSNFQGLLAQIEKVVINDKKFGLIQDYAGNWGKLTNEQSLSFIQQWLDADIATAQLRQRYVPIVFKVLDGKKSATFFQ
jgi:hypothetical protein